MYGKQAVWELVRDFSYFNENVTETIIRLSRILLADKLLAAVIVSYCLTTKLSMTTVSFEADVIDGLVRIAVEQTDISLVQKELHAYFAFYLNYGYGFELLARKANAVIECNWFHSGKDVWSVV